MQSLVFFFNLFGVLAVAIAIMVGVKDGRILQEAGLSGSCAQMTMPPGHPQVWHACKDGWVTGRPNMARYGCVRADVRGEHEIWLCPEELAAARSEH